MKYISVREFRSKVSVYMAELPFTLTVYNKPIAVVSKYNKDVVVVSENGSPTDRKKEALEEVKKEVKEIENSFSGVHACPKSAIKGKKMK